MDRRLLSAAIVVLALADGILHLSLDFILFRGNLVGRLGPPPGAPPGGSAPPAGAGPAFQLPLPLNQLFLLNFIGFVVLAAAFLWGERWLGRRRWLVDVALIVYAAVTIAGWLAIGRPNPMGLGYLAKALEGLLILALVLHLGVAARGRAAA